MPVPVARGLIFSLSLLIAAGIAVYEHPQVREWIDTNRRKLALALHGLGDEMHPGFMAFDDVSLREDASPEAVERRRIARDAILERARQMHEIRGVPLPRKRGASFDDLVDDEGNLHAVDRKANATTTALLDNGTQLRNRAAEAAVAGAAAGAAAANPFADEHMIWSFNSGMSEDEALERATASSLTLEHLSPSRESSMTLEHQSPFQSHTLSHHSPSEPDDLLDLDHDDHDPCLTPTTSRAPSSWHPNVLTPGSALDSGAATPRSVASPFSDDLVHSPLDNAILPPVASLSAATFQSIHDWAAASIGSARSSEPEAFYSPPMSEAAAPTAAQRVALSRTVSEDGELVHHQAPSSRTMSDDGEVVVHPDEDMLVDHADAASDHAEVLSAVSDLGSRAGSMTPGQWTEVGSVVSEEDGGH